MLWPITVAIMCASKLETILKIPQDNCDDILLADRIYSTKEITKLDSNFVSREIAVSHKTGNIYILDARPNIRVLRKEENGIQEINTKGAIVHTLAMDNSAGKLYLGCSRGFVTYDEANGTIEFVNGINYAIWKIFIPMNKSKLYAVSYEANEVIQFNNINNLTIAENLNLKIINGYSDRFVIDNDGNYYYNAYNKDGRDVTRVLRDGHTEPMEYTRYINNLAVDNKGRVFGTNYFDLYQLRSHNPEPQLLKSMKFMIRCISFDKYNNMVFGTFDKSIVILKLDNICYNLPENSAHEAERTVWNKSERKYINMMDRNYND